MFYKVSLNKIINKDTSGCLLQLGCGGRFFVPDEGLAIQVCYNLSHSDGTYEREVSALKKLPSALECERRLIITYDEEATIEDNNGKIEVLPYWKWVIA